MDRRYQQENEFVLEENDNDEYLEEPMVNAGELKSLSNQIEQFMSMMVTQKEETDQRMARLEQAILDSKKPPITPKPAAMLRPVVPTPAKQQSMYIAETVLHNKKLPARRESFYDGQVKKLEQVNQVAEQPLRLVQMAKEDDSYRMEHISIASLEVFEDRMLQMQDDISLANVKYARYLSKEVSRRVVRYLREVYKVDEENSLIAGRLTLSNQQIMEYLAEMATPKNEEDVITALRSVSFPRTTKAVSVQHFIPFYEALEVFNSRFKRRLKFLEAHCPDMVPPTLLGTEHCGRTPPG